MIENINNERINDWKEFMIELLMIEENETQRSIQFKFKLLAVNADAIHGMHFKLNWLSRSNGMTDWKEGMKAAVAAGGAPSIKFNSLTPFVPFI